MKVVFHSVDSDGNKIVFNAPCEVSGNTYKFLDKTVENTYIILTINDDQSINFNREGKVNMSMKFSLKEKTIGFYKNDMGLEFKLDLFTTYLDIKGNKLTLEYEMSLDDYKSTHKIYILFS